MKKSKYDLLASVSWRDVLGCIRWAITVRKHRAEDKIDDVQTDIKHNYPERLEDDTRQALGACEQVFVYVGLLNSVRAFLRYQSFTPDRLGLTAIYDFYREHDGDPEGGVLRG